MAESQIVLNVNGVSHLVDIEHRDSLLDVLREGLELTGAKRACDRGECGACTVLVEGKPMLACHLLAMQVRGREIVTVEGLAERPGFKPVLEAFLEKDGGQCGFCVPGFAVATYAALQHNPLLTPVELRWELVGHICRCNAYDRIAEAAAEAAVRVRSAK
ncbi:MAG TPA: (2Fe-2S)-binding protein [Dehalococcoidia bacterium]|nr:(2Fe-2S)-binding protein [Dehalococcoidia bacterium]